ncbi:hypothetical protein BX600DRAFT_534353, partial [Xylariales sp. PMI_506]
MDGDRGPRVQHWFYVVSPGSFEDFVYLLIPALRRRGRGDTHCGPRRELRSENRFMERGQARLRDNHGASKWKYGEY